MKNIYQKFFLGFILGFLVFYYLAKYEFYEALAISFFASLLTFIWGKSEKKSKV